MRCAAMQCYCHFDVAESVKMINAECKIEKKKWVGRGGFLIFVSLCLVGCRHFISAGLGLVVFRGDEFTCLFHIVLLQPLDFLMFTFLLSFLLQF